MYVYVKPLTENGTLEPNKNIFPRPCPWAVAWEATFLALLGRPQYKMAFIPHRYAKELHIFSISQDETFVVLSRKGREIARFDIMEITWAMAMEYDVQSFLYGFFFRVWHWRWNEFGKLTDAELRQKLARLEQKLERISEKRSERIEQSDDEE